MATGNGRGKCALSSSALLGLSRGRPDLAFLMPQPVAERGKKPVSVPDWSSVQYLGMVTVMS